MRAITDKVETHLERWTREEQFSGVVLLAEGDRIVLLSSHNQSCRRFGVPNRNDTRFDIASLGKMFTSVAIAQLLERGKLAFDSPIAAYLADYPPAVSEYVTVHHLLTHTSGLGSIFDGSWEVASKARFRTVGDIIPYFRDRPLEFVPGSRWEYSNAGFVLLGAVIEAVSGQSYPTYVQENIFTRAGMVDTGTYSLDEEVPSLAYGYSRLNPWDQEDTEPRWNNVYRHWTTSTPAGCMYSTAVDLLRFSLALRQGELLNSRLVTTVTEAKVETGRRPGESYGYGFFVEDLNGVAIYGHGGTIPGYQSWLDIYPSLGFTAIILTNFDAPAARTVAWMIREALTGVSPPAPIQ